MSRRGRIASANARSTGRPNGAARSFLRSRNANRPNRRAGSTSIKRSTSGRGHRARWSRTAQDGSGRARSSPSCSRSTRSTRARSSRPAAVVVSTNTSMARHAATPASDSSSRAMLPFATATMSRGARFTSSLEPSNEPRSNWCAASDRAEARRGRSGRGRRGVRTVSLARAGIECELGAVDPVTGSGEPAPASEHDRRSWAPGRRADARRPGAGDSKPFWRF